MDEIMKSLMQTIHALPKNEHGIVLIFNSEENKLRVLFKNELDKESLLSILEEAIFNIENTAYGPTTFKSDLLH